MNRRDALQTLAVGAVALGAGCVPSAPDPRVRLRRSDERGHADHGWLDARHTFSFARYHDPAHMGFRALRVLNEDRIAAASGFPMHPHRDMEIVTYVLEGAIKHTDSKGNGGLIVPGQIQYMSAGDGIYHSEVNPHRDARTHLLQIWIEPYAAGGAPMYDQRTFGPERENDLRLIASGDGRLGSMPVRQDVSLYASVLAEGRRLAYDNGGGRHVWLQLARGSIELNGHALVAGDAAHVSDAMRLELRATSAAELLLFDLA